jgi:DNA-binding MarR family transcriptional regulator
METDERKRSIEELATALRSLLSASDAFDQALGKVLGLNPTDVRCVDLLDRHGTMTAGSLAELAGLSTGAVTFLLDRLERAGFVSRVRDLDDRRRVLVELVPMARRQISELHKGLFEAWRASAQHFSLADLRRMIALVTEGTKVYESQLPLLWSRMPESHPGSRAAEGRAAIKEALKAQARVEAHARLEKAARKLQAKANELHHKAAGADPSY